jgi:hypothetical protein
VSGKSKKREEERRGRNGRSEPGLSTRHTKVNPDGSTKVIYIVQTRLESRRRSFRDH